MNSGIRITFVKRVFLARLAQLGLICIFPVVIWGFMVCLNSGLDYGVQLVLVLTTSVTLTSAGVKIWDINDFINGRD